MMASEDDKGAMVALRRPLATIGAGVALLGLWVLLQVTALGEVPFHTKGEAREGLVVWEMTHGGGWILPRRNGTEVPSKPPLFHWMGALTALATGRTDEWSIRLPSAALSLAGALGTYAAGTALWGMPAGFAGATIVLTSFEWQRAATTARVDMTLTLGLAMAFLAYLFFVRSGGRGAWLIPFYGGMVVAVLAKGPVGVVLPALLAAADSAGRRDAGPMRKLRPFWGLLTVTVIGGLWYALAVFEGGWAFFGKQVLNENLFRFADASQFEGGHRHSALYLLGALAAGFLPWTLFVPGVAVTLWRLRRSLAASDARVYLLLWILVVFGFYSLSVSKRGVYLLSLYPALGLLLGWWWVTVFQAGDESAADTGWLRATVRLFAWAALVVVAAVLVSILTELAGFNVLESIGGRLSEQAGVYGEGIGRAVRGRPWMSVVLAAAAVASLSQLAISLRGPRWRRAFAALVASLCAAGLLIRLVILPGVAGRETYRDFMQAVRQVVGASNRLVFFRTFDYGAVFYWGDHIREYGGELSAGSPALLLMTRDEWERTTPAQQERFERVALPAAVERGDRRRLVLVRRRDG